MRRKMSEEKLKTLKDLSSVSVNHVNHTKQKVVGIDDDNDLLFDNPPERRTENLDFVSYELLREEAKNWISQIEAKIQEKAGQFDDFGIDLGMEYAEKGEAIIGFIKHFFNLEEEGEIDKK